MQSVRRITVQKSENRNIANTENTTITGSIRRKTEKHRNLQGNPSNPLSRRIKKEKDKSYDSDN